VNAAVEGCLEAGAREIVVVDGHGHGAIDLQLLHPAARCLMGRPLGYPFGIDTSFDAALIIGQHAKAGTPNGHLCHTGTTAVKDLTINGLSLGEMGLNFLFAAYFGVPTVMVSGDEAACAEARDLVPEIETAAVKQGLNQGAAIHLSPERARAVIRHHAFVGLRRLGEIRPFWIEPPYEMVIRWHAEPGGQETVRINRGDDLLEVLSMPWR
jgi:D-amino peptidase